MRRMMMIKKMKIPPLPAEEANQKRGGWKFKTSYPVPPYYSSSLNILGIYALELKAGGKPSTWLPPDGLVELL